MVSAFLKARGLSVRSSPVEEDFPELAKGLEERPGPGARRSSCPRAWPAATLSLPGARRWVSRVCLRRSPLMAA
eukprot:2515659-Lingulodinium_polyedra.AAC.1